jgi:general secretion pathway protein G
MSFDTHHNGSGGDRGDGGFTMIELIIVVAVVGILASIVVFAMQNQQAKTLRGACTVDAHVVLSAQEARRTLQGSFAPDVASLVPDYIRSAPRNGDHYVITTDTTGNVYVAPAAGGLPEPVTAQPSPCGLIN